MGYCSEDWKSRIDPDAIYHIHPDEAASKVSPYRDYLYNQFTRQMGSLLESKKPRVENTRKGILNTRRLYRFRYDDQVFQKKTHVPTSDTTFLFLLDNSGSMSERFYPKMSGKDDDYSISCLDASNAVVSAFCKAVRTVLNNEIKVEVFYKSTPQNPFNGFVKGYTPTLTRVFSNTKNDVDWDKILKVDTYAPVMLTHPDGERSNPSGSYTPEFLLLPALLQWMRKNITTKNVCLINMTDGSVQHTFVKMDSEGDVNQRLRGHATDEDTGSLRVKYLRGVPHTTLFLGASSWMRETLEKAYGERNSKFVENETFVQDFFKLLNQMVDEYVQ